MKNTAQYHCLHLTVDLSEIGGGSRPFNVFQDGVRRNLRRLIDMAMDEVTAWEASVVEIVAVEPFTIVWKLKAGPMTNWECDDPTVIRYVDEFGKIHNVSLQ